MFARIYRPTKSAMQSGQANTKSWVFEFEPREPKRKDILMGWVGSVDMQSQVKLKFSSREEAISYAERNGYQYSVFEPQRRQHRPKSYADNFRFGKVS